MLSLSLLAALGACGRGCERLAGPDAAAWRLLDVTAGALLAGVWLLPHLGELVMLGPLGDALRTLASVDALHLDARSAAPASGCWPRPPRSRASRAGCEG